MKVVTDLSVTSRPFRKGSTFDPGALFSGGEAGGAYLAARLEGVFSDQDGLVPAQIGQSVARIDDMGPNMQHVIQPSAALRPLLGRAPLGAAPGGAIDQGSGPAFIRFDLSDDVLRTSFPDGGTFDVMVFGRQGSWIEQGVTIAPSGQLSIGARSFSGAPDRVLEIMGDIVGWVAIDRTLTGAEINRLVQYHKARGAKGLLTPGPELLPEGEFSQYADTAALLAVWDELSNTTATLVSGPVARVQNVGGNSGTISRPLGLDEDKRYLVEAHITAKGSGFARVLLGPIQTATTSGQINAASPGLVRRALQLSSDLSFVGIGNRNDNNSFSEWSRVSVRELRPEEDW